ncbi:hypothetical protein Droror1_Dr00026772, partial [Drosera rotundifolia]
MTAMVLRLFVAAPLSLVHVVFPFAVQKSCWLSWLILVWLVAADSLSYAAAGFVPLLLSCSSKLAACRERPPLKDAAGDGTPPTRLAGIWDVQPRDGKAAAGDGMASQGMEFGD